MALRSQLVSVGTGISSESPEEEPDARTAGLGRSKPDGASSAHAGH